MLQLETAWRKCIAVELARKARGAFFTPPEIARYLSAWAIQSPSDCVFEPSAGEASFLLAAAERIRHLGGDPSGLLSGSEIHGPSAAAGRLLLRQIGVNADIAVEDFFDRVPEPFADAVIGNPPYIRYQEFAGIARARAQAAALAAGVRIDGLASSWAAFVIHAARFLKPDGRLALVLPAELLHVKYAAPVRNFLVNRFENVNLVTFERLVFPEVQSDVVLLLAGGSGKSRGIHVTSARDASDLGDLHYTETAQEWRWSSDTEKWSSVLLPSEALEAYRDALPAFTHLGHWGRTYLGTVTGSNGYFTLSANEATLWNLDNNDLLKISPPGSRHLRGPVFSKSAFEEMRNQQRRVYLFYPQQPINDAARSYIAAGKSRSVDAAYKCRVRSPWWKVPIVPIPDLFLTYMNHDSVHLVWNEAQVHFLNSVHGVSLNPDDAEIGKELLPIAALNSLTLLGAEIVGRSYGGGVLKLEPREADTLPLPTPETVRRAATGLRSVAPQLSIALRSGDITAASRLVDEALLVRSMGTSRRLVRHLQEGRSILKARRLERPRG